MSMSCRTARGVSASPHVFSRGNVLRSTTHTSWPASASQYAVAAPAGPPPTIRTSCMGLVTMGSGTRQTRDAGGGEPPGLHGEPLGTLLRAPVDELLARLIAGTQFVALVADHGQQLRVRELA